MEQPSSDSNISATLLDLPENLLLHHILSEFAAAPHTLLHFSSTCKHAHRLANAPGLWTSFCQEHVASELASCFAEPEHWRAANHKQLWIGLLLPYGQLLGRLWHSTTSPSGMLLAVDAEAPRLLARSIYYHTLNGGPFCHDIFAVELPGPQSKAVVTCWRDKHSTDMHESPARLAPAGPTAGATSATTAGSAADDGSDSGGSGSCSASSSAVVANLLNGFELCCQGRCDALAVEFTSRRLASQRYAAARQQHAAASLQQQQQRQQAMQQSGSSSSSSSSSNNGAGAATAVSSSNGKASEQQGAPAALAPLPEMQRINVIDLIQFISVADMQRRCATPFYRPLNLSPWLPAVQPPSTAAADASLVTTGTAALEPEAASACEGVSAAALSLPGCWRGTYGSHAIELIQLQLLLASPGYDMFAPQTAEGGAAAAAAGADSDAADALAADSDADAVPGVLLAGMARIANARARVASSLRALAEQAVAEQGDTADVAGQQQPNVTPQERQQQQRQLLLVATKLTGDVNVPAGAATFAVDLGSRCTAGAGSRLVLPPGTDSDVQLNRAGMRQLRVTERYRARAQIAYTKFDRPQVIAAELLLFDSHDCMGLLWKRPVDSFSLFSRASQLPGVADA